MSNRRILGFTWLALTAMLAYVFSGLTGWVWLDLLARDSTMTVPLIGGLPIATVIGVTVAAVAGLLTWNREELRDYSDDVVTEMRKVVWPTLEQTRQATIVVIATVFVFAFILGGFDFVWGKVSGFILYRAG